MLKVSGLNRIQHEERETRGRTRLPLYALQISFIPMPSHCSFLIAFSVYRNSLFVRCKNIFERRKRTKIFYTNVILPNENFCALVGSWLHTSASPNCCCPYILVYMVASNTTSCLLFTSHLFCTLCDLLN